MTGLRRKQRKNSPQSTKSYYPVYLNLRGRTCVLIGGGKVAERKCISLLKAGADVTVISPFITKKIEDYKNKGMIKHICRSYRKGDLRSAYIVIAATDSEETNRNVYEELKGKNVLFNVVDNPELCTFIVPSIVERGNLKIAISTGGISPAVSKQLRKELEVLYSKDFSRYLNLLEDLRGQIKDRIKDRQEREDLLRQLASPEFINILREKGFKAAKEKILSTLSIQL